MEQEALELTEVATSHQYKNRCRLPAQRLCA